MVYNLLGIMASSNKAKKPNDFLNKRIPENPKYKGVKATVDTGASVTKYLEKIEDLRKNYRLRKDEIFKRMKPSTYAQLVLQVAQVVTIELERERLSTVQTNRDFDENDEIPHLNLAAEEKNNNPPDSSRSTLQGVISGIGEVDIKDTEYEQQPPVTGREMEAPDAASLPYLLLDVRDRDAFDKCHMIGAKSYPSAMLSRSVNYFTKEILEFRNKTGKIIVVYDEDERIATNVATIFVQRDVDNVFLLSGGMKVISKKFPGCFTTGPLPASCLPTPPPNRKAKPKPKSPEQNEERHLAWFTSEKIEKIEDLLDEELLKEDSSRMSSRVSSRSTVASKASVRTTTTQNSGRSSSRPWK
ncbi:centrosomal protein of 41 kDa-like [Rhopilema esculentum]|uniref:centrosomal protein of 41 kDa-like n=1 Tax=Rhopilema esculentum TaxID=499914 RepID=UPI0031DB61F2